MQLNGKADDSAEALLEGAQALRSAVSLSVRSTSFGLKFHGASMRRHNYEPPFIDNTRPENDNLMKRIVDNGFLRKAEKGAENRQFLG